MKTIDDAWAWYENGRHLLGLMKRLGGRYWNEIFPEGSRIARDDRFRHLKGENVERDADAVLEEFDDIAVFVLFSVFEAIVRDRIKEEVKAEAATLRHDALRAAARRIVQGIEEGSFHQNVLVLFKNRDHNLIEMVNQVRQHRNWVAHGRRADKRPVAVKPRDAYDRLKAFLDLIGQENKPAR